MKTICLMLLLAVPVNAMADNDQALSLDAARAKWAKAEISSYKFSIKATCFCLNPKYKSPARIVVVHGKVRSAKYIDSVESFMSGDVPADARLRYSVDDLFDLIDKGIQSKYLDVDVTYDEITGRPIKIYLDPGAITDDEVLYEISSFST